LATILSVRSERRWGKLAISRGNYKGMTEVVKAIVPKGAYDALLEHGRAIEEGLREVLSPPILSALQRIGDAACSADASILEQAASIHPVQEAPYTAIPADFTIEPGTLLPRGEAAVKAALRQYWPQRHRHDQSSHGIPIRNQIAYDVNRSLEAALISADGALGMNDDTWEAYVKSHIAEHDRDFCTLLYLAADYNSRRYPIDSDDFTVLERQLIDEYLTYSYPTMLVQATGSLNRLSQTVIFPLSPEMRAQNIGYAERILRAAAFIIEALEVDDLFLEDIAQVTEVNYELIEKFTFRAKDQPQDVLGSGLRGTQESIGRAVLPLVAELLRGHETNAPANAGLIAKQNVAARATRLAPLGYSGPVGLQGVGTTDQLVDIVDNRALISSSARSAFAIMNDRWRTEFHYPRLAAYLQEVADGKPDARRYERTGIRCPFATPFHSSEAGLSSPGVVAEAARLMIVLADLMPEGANMSKYSRDNPYRPWEALPSVRGILQKG